MEHIITNIAQKKIVELNKLGYIEGGHNGPYYDTDTPVRNTAHFAIIFSYMYKHTKDKKYFAAVKKCGDYLISKDARPMNANFFCRYNTTKDFCNGTIGAAWAIEGLVEAYKVTNDIKYIIVAQEVFELFKFDEKRTVWTIVNVDGSLRDIDRTYNHQLWLAAAGVQIISAIENKNIRKSCELFFDNMEVLFNSYSNGLIKHPLYPKYRKMDTITNTLRKAKLVFKSIKTGKTPKYKENGYHLFNIYAFAIIYELGWDISFFKTSDFQKTLQYCFSDELYDWLENKPYSFDIYCMPKVKKKDINIYGYSYNVPGFELPYIYKVFKDIIGNKDKFVQNVIDKQIKYIYNEDSISFDRNNEDSGTLDARLYEYVKSL